MTKSHRLVSEIPAGPLRGASRDPKAGSEMNASHEPGPMLMG